MIRTSTKPLTLPPKRKMNPHRLPLLPANLLTPLLRRDPKLRRKPIPQPHSTLNRPHHLLVAQRLQRREVEREHLVELRGRAVDAEVGYIAHFDGENNTLRVREDGRERGRRGLW
jgi:hypothetical protein